MNRLLPQPGGFVEGFRRFLVETNACDPTTMKLVTHDAPGDGLDSRPPSKASRVGDDDRITGNNETLRLNDDALEQLKGPVEAIDLCTPLVDACFQTSAWSRVTFEPLR